MDRARLAPVNLPDFGMPAAMPSVPTATYAALPFSNMPALLSPFVLRSDQAMTLVD